ncbi:hypothetical protein BDZ91DRAFT_166803 [Kalaharituber pfeilii]|nr:hypothetical protein BDZ91DRAFT_166803 [Kalaharituber pfeilii]
MQPCMHFAYSYDHQLKAWAAKIAGEWTSRSLVLRYNRKPSVYTRTAQFEFPLSIFLHFSFFGIPGLNIHLCFFPIFFIHLLIIHGYTFLGHSLYAKEKNDICNTQFYQRLCTESTAREINDYLKNLGSGCTVNALRRVLRPQHHPLISGDILPSYIKLGNYAVHELTLGDAKDTILYYSTYRDVDMKSSYVPERTLGRDLESLVCLLLGIKSLDEIRRCNERENFGDAARRNMAKVMRLPHYVSARKWVSGQRAAYTAAKVSQTSPTVRAHGPISIDPPPRRISVEECSKSEGHPNACARSPSPPPQVRWNPINRAPWISPQGTPVQPVPHALFTTQSGALSDVQAVSPSVQSTRPSSPSIPLPSSSLPSPPQPQHTSKSKPHTTANPELETDRAPEPEHVQESELEQKPQRHLSDLLLRTMEVSELREKVACLQGQFDVFENTLKELTNLRNSLASHSPYTPFASCLNDILAKHGLAKRSLNADDTGQQENESDSARNTPGITRRAQFDLEELQTSPLDYGMETRRGSIWIPGTWTPQGLVQSTPPAMAKKKRSRRCKNKNAWGKPYSALGQPDLKAEKRRRRAEAKRAKKARARELTQGAAMKLASALGMSREPVRLPAVSKVDISKGDQQRKEASQDAARKRPRSALGNDSELDVDVRMDLMKEGMDTEDNKKGDTVSKKATGGKMVPRTIADAMVNFTAVNQLERIPLLGEEHGSDQGGVWNGPNESGKPKADKGVWGTRNDPVLVSESDNDGEESDIVFEGYESDLDLQGAQEREREDLRTARMMSTLSFSSEMEVGIAVENKRKAAGVKAFALGNGRLASGTGDRSVERANNDYWGEGMLLPATMKSRAVICTLLMTA